MMAVELHGWRRRRRRSWCLARALRPPQVVKRPQRASTHKKRKNPFREEEEKKMVESIKLLCLYGNDGNALFICLIKEKFKWPSGGSSERIKTGGRKSKCDGQRGAKQKKKQGGFGKHTAPIVTFNYRRTVLLISVRSSSPELLWQPRFLSLSLSFLQE